MKIRQITISTGEVFDYVYALMEHGEIYVINADRPGEKWRKIPSLIDQLNSENNVSNSSNEI
jgi:hypothetical protein